MGTRDATSNPYNVDTYFAGFRVRSLVDELRRRAWATDALEGPDGMPGADAIDEVFGTAKVRCRRYLTPVDPSIAEAEIRRTVAAFGLERGLPLRADGALELYNPGVM